MYNFSYNAVILNNPSSYLSKLYVLKDLFFGYTTIDFQKVSHFI